MKFRIILVFMLSWGMTHGQASFYKTFKGSSFDVGQGVVQLPDSSYTITGSTGSFSPLSGQIFLMNIDSAGNHQWTTSYGDEGSDWGRRVFHEPNEGFWVAGYSNSTVSGDFDFIFLKTDEAGNQEWMNYYGTSDWEKLYDAKRLNDGSFVLVGTSEGQNSIEEDIFLVRLTPQGDTIWTRKISTLGKDIAYTVEVLNDTTFLLGGTVSDGFQNQLGTILALDTSGTTIWVQHYSDYGEVVVHDLSVFNDEIYASGSLVFNGEEDLDIWIIATDNLGNKEHEETINLSGDDFINNIVAIAEDKVFVSHLTNSPASNPFPGGEDLIIMKYHTHMFWNFYSNSFSGYDPDIAHELIETIEGGVMIVGEASDVRDALSSGRSVLAIKIGPNEETTFNPDLNEDFVDLPSNLKQKSFSIYPNPTKKNLNISGLNELEYGNYQIYSPEGKLVQNGKLENVIELGSLSKGIYFFNFSIDGINYSSRIVKE